jgi:hypothetical protein
MFQDLRLLRYLLRKIRPLSRKRMIVNMTLIDTILVLVFPLHLLCQLKHCLLKTITTSSMMPHLYILTHMLLLLRGLLGLNLRLQRAMPHLHREDGHLWTFREAQRIRADRWIFLVRPVIRDT